MVSGQLVDLQSSSLLVASTTFLLGPFVPPGKDCSTHLVHELLLAPDVFHLLLQSFGTNSLTLFDLLKLLEPFVPD